MEYEMFSEGMIDYIYGELEGRRYADRKEFEDAVARVCNGIVEDVGRQERLLTMQTNEELKKLMDIEIEE